MSKNYIADKFIKINGSSNQFLKADGSIDSNTYLTSQTDSQSLSWVDGTNTLSISSGNSVVITGFADSVHTHTFTSLTSRPTTLSGYGITDTPWTSYLPLSGGTVSGNLIINTNSEVNGLYITRSGGTTREVVKHSVNDSQYNTYYINDESSASIRWTIENNGIEAATPASTNTLEFVSNNNDAYLILAGNRFYNQGNFLPGTGATNWTAGNDSRLSDTRTPSNDSNLVHRTGDEIVGGVKTFSDFLKVIKTKGSYATPFSTSTITLGSNNQLDNDSYTGISFATSATSNYGYTLGAKRTTAGNGTFLLKSHFNSDSGVEILSIDAVGAAILASSISSTAFIKSGGTSAQFLKADGSVDTSIYLTAETDNQTLSWTDATNTISIARGNSVVITGFADSVHTHSLLTRGSYLIGGNYDGGSAQTWAVDATVAATPSKVVARDSNGYIFAVYLNSSNTPENNAASNYSFDIGDGYHRRKSLSNVRTEIVTYASVIAGLGFIPYNTSNPSGYTNNTGTVTSVGGTGTVNGLTLSGSITTSGSLVLGGTLSGSATSLTVGNSLKLEGYSINNILAITNGNFGSQTQGEFDFNNAVNAGVYNLIWGGFIANTPTDWALGSNHFGTLTCIGNEPSRFTQIIHEYPGIEYYRTKSGTTWGSWRKVLDTSNFISGTGSINYAAGNDLRINNGQAAFTSLSNYLPLVGGTLSGTLTVNTRVTTNEIRTLNNQSLVFNAGESWNEATGQTEELVYINAESGIEINSSPDNWANGWSTRKTTRIGDSSGNSTFGGSIKTVGIIELGSLGTTNFKALVFNGTDATTSGILKATTGGNVHLDGSGTGRTYLNYYTGSGGIYFGNGAGASNANIGADGSASFASIISALGGNSTNWNSAFGWGNHASAGYITSYDDTNTTYTSSLGISLSGTDFRPTYGVTANTITQGDDFRLSNTRTPSNDSNLVHRTDIESIAGVKTFTESILLGAGQIQTSAAALQVNGFQRTGNIYLHTGGNTPDTVRGSDFISNDNGILTWSGSSNGSIYHSGNFTTGSSSTNYIAGNDTRVNNGQTAFNSLGNYLPLAGGTVSGVTTFSVGATFNGPVNSNSGQSRDKIRVWNSSEYAIGMLSSFTFGGLNNDYAMTFQMSNTNSRGFWWGDSSHTNAQGAMSLTTNGLLTIASGVRVGYGELDTVVPTANTLDVKGGIKSSDGTNGCEMKYNTSSKTMDFIFN